MKKFINCKYRYILIMVEFKVLSLRRKYLLEQIGAAADEIKQIDEDIASLQSSMKKDCSFLQHKHLNGLRAQKSTTYDLSRGLVAAQKTGYYGQVSGYPCSGVKSCAVVRRGRGTTAGCLVFPGEYYKKGRLQATGTPTTDHLKLNLGLTRQDCAGNEKEYS